MDQEYTGKNCTSHLGQPYLLSNLGKLNILADAMEKKSRFGWRIIDCQWAVSIF